MNAVVAPVEPKKIVSVEILHLDKLGYGPEGKHTRREWRAECLENLSAGKEQFEGWQASWKYKIDKNQSAARYGIVNKYEDGTKLELLNDFLSLKSSCAFDFSGHTFVSELDCIYFEFQETAIFSFATFTKDADFVNAIFKKHADFDGARFKLAANLGNATFKWFADFRLAMFMGDADFRNATFAGNGDFLLAMFEGYADFNSVTFKVDAIFSGGKFFAGSMFNGAMFGSDAFFAGTTFTEDAYFNNITFTADAIFRKSSFAKDASFFKTKFNNQCRFDIDKVDTSNIKTIFNGAVNFENAEIQNVGHFERVQFNGEIPNFLGVDNSKTLLIFSDETYFNKLDTTEDAVKRIAQLKRLADEQGQTDQALMFNAFELNAKRAQAREKTQHLTWKQKANNADYWFANATAGFRIFSDYGRSFFEPLKWYLALLGVTFYLAVAHAVYYTNKECLNEYANMFSYLWREQIQCAPVKPKDNETPILLSGWRAAVEYTSYRASGILDFADSDKQTIAISNRLFNQPIEPPWMRAWGIFKGIASIALLFLAALGLRNKYRIK